MKAFGIRHLSPAGAYYVRKFLDLHQPDVVFIEGPADFNPLMEGLTDKEIRPPFAIMAYTVEAPVQTICYPFAQYSPEYQAILWARENQKECRFFDLPSNYVLALPDRGRDEKEVKEKISLYERIASQSEDGDIEYFWERNIEQAKSVQGYMMGSRTFGEKLRENTPVTSFDMVRDLLRERFMKRKINDCIASGVPEEKIVAITGAFHTVGIEDREDEMRDEDLESLPSVETKVTLMPYSYYRLSKYSGYGAGNAAPAYYELLWEGLNREDVTFHEQMYLTKLANYMRLHGGIVSSAQVIESVRLARELARLRGGEIPTLTDLKDASVTCMGEGKFGEMAMGFAEADIGTKIGSIPEGVSQTSIQNDFYRQLKQLKLEKYKDSVTQQLKLDLRENLRVKTKESAFLDLNRSFFLHRLCVLGIDFAQNQRRNQEGATWAEDWLLLWSVEAEIQIVESILKGDTIKQAVSYTLVERMKSAHTMAELSQVMEDAFYCGMPEILQNAMREIDNQTAGAIAIHDIAITSKKLSDMLLYGDIRKLNREPIVPVLTKLCLRASLTIVSEAFCDDVAAQILCEDIQILHNVFLANEMLDYELWMRAMMELARRDDVNTRVSGICMSILLDCKRIDANELGNELSKRLSRGMPADLGAGWFSGLSMRNHYALIARLSIWEALSDYLDTLDDEEFKRSLLFLRRAFAEYDPKEKDMIAENLGEIWGVNKEEASEIVNTPITSEDVDLGDFSFDDF